MSPPPSKDPMKNIPASSNSNAHKFTSRQYISKVIQNLDQLRLSSKFCDVEISADGKSFEAHRVVLASSSKYFEAMFTSGLIEETQSKIEIHSIPSETFSILLDFIYTGEIKISQENVQEMMTAANMLQLEEVVFGCTQFLKNELHPSNAIGIHRLAEVHNCTELFAASAIFIQSHFPLVCCEEEFLDVPYDQLKCFLSSEYLRVDTEYQVFEAAMRWLSHDLPERKQYVFGVLGLVRLPLLSVQSIDKAILECTDISVKVALKSIRSDLMARRGSLVPVVGIKPRKAAKKDIYVIGGSKRELVSSWTRSEYIYETVERFDTFKKQWAPRVSPMAIGRILPGVVALDGLIYVVGGEQGSQILANGEVYDPRENKWSKVASMVVPRCEFGLCALDGFLYAIGGWVGEDIGGSIEKYDPKTNNWSLDGSLPAPRFSMGAVAYQGLIYIVGGCVHNKRHLQDLLSYNPMTSEWSQLSPMLIPRSQMGVAILDNYLYVIGGTNRRHDVLQSVERYNFMEDKWSEVKPLSLGRASPAVAAADGLLYVMGGDQAREAHFYRAQITMSSMEIYNPMTDTWCEGPQLPESRSEAGAVVV